MTQLWSSLVLGACRDGLIARNRAPRSSLEILRFELGSRSTGVAGTSLYPDLKDDVLYNIPFF